MNKNIFLIVFILISITASQLNAQQTVPLEKPSSTGQSFSRMELAPTLNMQQSLEKEVAILRGKVETQSEMMNLLIGALIAVMALGAIASLFSGWFVERRSRESHSLAIAGERASQDRARVVHDTFLAGSKTTLDLVNATLTLAKEASEKAARVMETKAHTMLEELDKNAKNLIASVPTKDERVIATDPARRSAIRSIVQKITIFDTFKFILPTELQLTPPCLFIKGMDFHLNQQFDDAFECWRSVALHDDTPDLLKSMAWHWIGMEHNNLGQFRDACLSFERALETATGARRYELQRILIESHFFNKSTEPAESLISPLEDLLRSIGKESSNEELEASKRKILTTLGNVYYQVGNELRKAGKVDKAKEKYESAKDRFKEAPIKENWALFGFAEALYRLEEKGSAETIFKRIRGEAINEYIRKEEPRAKLLARTTELICCIRVTELKNEIPGAYSQVIEALSRVDERLTVYSQLQMRNVTKAEFKEDIEELKQEGVL